jgi:hypothetical protein
MAQQPKKRKRKVKRKVRVSTKAKVRKKSEQPKDTLKKMDAQMPRTVAPVLKIKVRKK